MSGFLQLLGAENEAVVEARQVEVSNVTKMFAPTKIDRNDVPINIEERGQTDDGLRDLSIGSIINELDIVSNFFNKSAREKSKLDHMIRHANALTNMSTSEIAAAFAERDRLQSELMDLLKRRKSLERQLEKLASVSSESGI